jgi:hypothetical protein
LQLISEPRLGERSRFDDDLGVAPQRGGQRRQAGTDVARVADHDRVRAEELRPLGRVVVERTAVLLLALEHDLDPDRWPAVEGAQGPEVRDQVRLVVRDAAPIDSAVPLGRLEGRRVPAPLVTGRLDVLVRVEQNGRRTLRRRDLADDDRRGAGERQGVDALDAGIPQELSNEIVGVEYRRRREVGKGDRRDAGQPARGERSSQGLRDLRQPEP